MYVERDLTPPPIDIEDIRQADSIPPPIKEQMVTMASWVEKLAGERTSGIRLDRIEDKLGSLAQSASRHDAILNETLRPQLDYWRATTDDLTQQLPKLIGSVDGLSMHVKDLTSRLRDVEFEIRSMRVRFEAHERNTETQFAAVERARQSFEQRLASLELVESNRNAASLAIAKQERKKSGRFSAAVSAVVAIAVAVASHLAR